MRGSLIAVGWALLLVPAAAAWSAGDTVPSAARALPTAGHPGRSARDSMQAMVLRDGKLVLQAVPLPEPGTGQVRIRIRAAGVNPADWKMARAGGRLGPDPILGLDASGTIDALGPQVTGWKRGEAVIALTRPPHGSYAQYALVSTDFIAPKPHSLSFDQAAGIPVAGITAWRSLVDVAHLQSGQRVLIDGAAGGVGSAAVQIAKAHGAYVIGTASPRHASYLRTIGADEVIDYTAGPFEQKVSNVDVVLETVSRDDGLRALRTLKPGGMLVSIAGAMPLERCTAAHVRCAAPGSSGGQPATAYLADIDRLVAAGKYRVSVERTLPLREAAEALRLSREGHTQGKLILAVPN